MMILLKIENVKKKINIGTSFTYNDDATPVLKKPAWRDLTRFFLFA